MSITINSAKKAAIDARAREAKGRPMDPSETATKKEEIAALVKQGKTSDAITQLIELL
jgi:hypothetical protein